LNDPEANFNVNENMLMLRYGEGDKKSGRKKDEEAQNNGMGMKKNC